MSVPGKLQHDLQKRLRFIEGQARGVQNMVEVGRDPADILNQLVAIQSAARAAAELIVRERMIRRIKESIARAVLECVGNCDVCDELDGMTELLSKMDYSAVLEEVLKLRPGDLVAPADYHQQERR